MGTGENVPGLGQNQYWYEVLPPESSIVALPLSANVGYKQHVYTSYVLQATTNVYVFQFFGYNYYNGKSVSFEWNPYPSGGVTGIYDGSHSDFVVERPSVNGSFTNLSNFGTVDYTGYSNNNTIATYANDAVTMYDGAGNVMASPSSLSNGDEFSVTQHKCG